MPAQPTKTCEHQSNLLERLSALRIPSPAVVTALMVACVFLLRMPAILYAHELGEDESQMFSQGMRFLVDPVPWRGVDGTTSGPLNSYLVSLVLLLGIKPGFVMGHVLAAVLICLQLVVAHRTLLRLGSQRTAAWGMVPMVLFFCITGINDYLHYSSELLPSLLLSLGFYCFVVWMEDRPGRGASFQTFLVLLSGLLWGTAPWAKLQAGPISGVLGIVFLATVLTGVIHPLGISRRVVQSLTFCAGALLPGAVILAIVLHAGVYRDFWNSYILENLAFAGAEPWTQTLTDCVQALFSVGMGPIFLINVLAAGFLVHARRTNPAPKLPLRQRWANGALLLFLGTALFTAVRPATFFLHYLQFMVYPMICLTAGLMSRATPIFRNFRQGNRRMPVAVNTAFGAILAYCLVNSVLYVTFSGFAILDLFRPQSDPNDKIAAVVKKLGTTRPVQNMMVWGWAAGVYVASGIPPATRDSITQRAIEKGPMQAYYRQRLLGDLRGNMPDLFVDAIGPGTFKWFWKENYGYESNPELKEYIDRNYDLVDILALRPGKVPVRFFARRGAASQQQAALKP